MPTPATEIIDLAPGLWLWRTTHPHWQPNQGWDPLVTCTCVESAGVRLLLDPLAPPPSATTFWNRLDAHPPHCVVILKPDHIRDVDLFVTRYHARAFGPDRFTRDDIPKTHLDPIFPGAKLPGDLLALYDGRGRSETPLWLPHHRTLVFADALTAPHGELRIWSTPWHQQRVVPALRALLDLPFAQIIVSHGAPLHDRAAFTRALDLPPWTG